MMDQTIDINGGSSRREHEALPPASRSLPPASRYLPPPPQVRLRSLPVRPFRPFLPCPAFLRTRPFRAFLPYRPFRACLPYRPFRACLRILHNVRLTLHLGGIESSESFVGLFCLLVLIDPLGPIDLDVLILVLGLEQSGPEGGTRVELLDDEDEVEAGLGPLGGCLVDGLVELEGEGVLLSVTVSKEGQGGLRELDGVVLDVPQLHLQVDALLPLRPFRDRVTSYQYTYSIC